MTHLPVKNLTFFSLQSRADSHKRTLSCPLLHPLTTSCRLSTISLLHSGDGERWHETTQRERERLIHPIREKTKENKCHRSSVREREREVWTSAVQMVVDHLNGDGRIQQVLVQTYLGKKQKKTRQTHRQTWVTPPVPKDSCLGGLTR